MNAAKKILVVDDDAALRHVIALQVEGLGYDVVQACDARSAVETLKTSKFDGIVTDFQMPGGMDGVDLLKHLHDNGMTPESVVLASGAADLAIDKMSGIQPQL